MRAGLEATCAACCKEPVIWPGRGSDLPVCHLLPVPAEGVVRRSGLPAAQGLPQTAVEGAEAPQVGNELPEAEQRKEI